MNFKRNYFILPFALALIISQCNPQKSQKQDRVPDFNPLVTAFTSGLISSESGVKIRFSENFADTIVANSILPGNVFSFSPDVEGEAYYIDRRTIEFRPTGRFKAGTAYMAKVKLSDFYPEAGKNGDFEFGFNTISQHISLNIEGFRPYNDYRPEINYLSGVIYTADVAEPEAVESVLDAMQDSRKLSISWDHLNNGKQHNFTVDSVLRSEEEGAALIRFDGAPIEAEQSGEETFLIPSLSSFKIISHKVIQYPEQHIVIGFSDPIRKNQVLDGLVRLETNTDMKFNVEGNNIHVYPEVRQKGNLNLFIEPGIKNVAGKALSAGETLSVIFQEIDPAVQLLGNGVIVPQSEEVLLPFKAVNLKAVDVKVIKIYEDNIAQFLQVNELSGSRELKRAGRLILKKRVDLFSEKAISYGEWNTFSLNLSSLVKTEPGAIYRIEIGFRQSYSLYPCEEDSPKELQLEESDENFNGLAEEELSYWDSYESYYNSYDYYYYDGYDWEDRENPCMPAYYGNRRSVSRNILSSNIGLIAKRGSGKQLVVTTTDLIQATPLNNANVKVYNFQQQLMSEGISDSDGIVKFELESNPFLVVAKSGTSKGYLKLNDGSSLSYSMFDVSGTRVKKGLKGFIYGERGVWRPGDSIFVNFILDDSENPIPDNHPVLFELKDPRGKVVQKGVETSDGSGFYSFHTKTETKDPTGNYSVYARIGGASFYKTIRVESIKPNRLKINLSFNGDTIYPDQGFVEGSLFSKWLTGATARNLKAEVEVFLRPAKTVFKAYEGYVFEDPSREFYSYPTAFYSGQLDETGIAKISKELEVSGEAPGMLNALFTTRIFEKSGDFSIDQKLVPCSPYSSYVGIRIPEGDKRGMLLTDTLHKIDVVTLDNHGNPVTKPGLSVSVYKLDWRWWWESSSENLASFIGRNYQSQVMSRTISTKKGKGSFTFRIEYPEWGRYLVLVKDENGGHSAGKIIYIDWPGWAGRAKKGADAAAVLSFSSSKSKYSVGEKAEITIPSSEEGRILVSIENGSGIIKQEWIGTTGSDTKYSFDITSEMAPNIYLYASLIQAHGNTNNDRPIRMFGIIPILVEDPETRLQPILDMPDELSPNSEVKLKVSEKSNKEMTYTIAMVDEGLLDLTRFRTPDPWSSFYAKEALGVKTWDMFDHVLGAFGGRIDGVYNIGGGMDEEGTDGAKEANRFPPMVKFLGPYDLKGKSNTHIVSIPNYIGSVRTMLIAGNGRAYGSVDKTTAVKQPLMVLATLPRVLGPGETVNLPVNVFVMDEKIKDVKVDIVTNELLIADEMSKNIRFSETGDKIVDFRLKTPQKTGLGTVKIMVSSGRETAEYHIELNVRSSNPPVTLYTTHAIEPGSSISEEIAFVGMPGTNDLEIEVSNIPPLDFGRRLKYLLQYPHGCIEQTTSAAFPQLYLSDVVEITDAAKAMTEKNIKAAIKSMSSFQLADGSFTYWPGRSGTSSWGTSYAGHFLIEAANKGYTTPKALMNNWKKYQKKTAKRWSLSGKSDPFEIKQEQIMQSYRLFTLSLAGEPELGAMNRMRERPDLVSEAKWRLAAAYALAGQVETAMELSRKCSTDVEEYKDSRFSFGSSVRDRAMILEAMVLMDLRNEAVPLLETVAQSLSSQSWMSTQTTAYSLIAVAKFTGGVKPKGNLKFEYSMNGAGNRKAETGHALAQVTLDPGDKASGTLVLANTGESMVYLRIVNSGVPPVGSEDPIKNNLQVKVRYLNMEGQPIKHSAIEHGSDFKVEYSVYNPGILGAYYNLALTTIFPSGWEIHNERMFNTNNETQSLDYQDIKDDRVMTYFNLLSRQTKKFTIRMNAAYKGRFYLPSVQAGEMYRNDIQVLIPGEWIEVKAVE